MIPADRMKYYGFCSMFRKKKKKSPQMSIIPKNCIDHLLDRKFQILLSAGKNLPVMII